MLFFLCLCYTYGVQNISLTLCWYIFNDYISTYKPYMKIIFYTIFIKSIYMTYMKQIYYINKLYHFTIPTITFKNMYVMTMMEM